MDFLASALQANRELFALIRGGELKRDFFLKDGIGAGGDLSAGIDLLAEEIFLGYLGEFGRVISEEGGVLNSGELEIYLDPIDGSDNFLSGFPYFGTSVSLCRGGEAIASMVCNLANGDCYSRDKEGLKYTNISSSGFRNYDLFVNSYIGILEKPYANIPLVHKLTENKMKFRSPGAVALSLMYARNTEFTIFGGKIREYDVRAGLHLCEDLYISKGEEYIAVSKNRETLEKIVSLIKGVA